VTVPEITVGVCEDDPHLRSVLERALRQEGFVPRMAATGHDAIATFTKAPPDVLVLDIGLPDADGRDVCQALRVHGVGSPVIFLTARDGLTDRLSGFHLGADDYVTKPFAVAELLARIRVAVRRHTPGPDLTATGLTVDPVTHAVRVGDRTAKLTPTEFRLLGALAAEPGSVVRRHALRTSAWPEGAIVHDNTIDAYIVRLRRKLGEVEAAERIETVRGVGYVLR
jgi:two-component system response regulator MprA